MPERCHRDDDAGYVVRRLQQVCPTQGGADAFPERIHPPFSNRRVSGLIGTTPDWYIYSLRIGDGTTTPFAFIQT